MGYRQHADARLASSSPTRRRHRPQGVDVEPGIDLVQDGDAGAQHPQLEHLVALAFPARKVDVEGPRDRKLSSKPTCLASAASSAGTSARVAPRRL